MKTTPTAARLENDLAPFVTKILAQHHRIEFAFYAKSMKLIIDLRKRYSQQYMPLPLIVSRQEKWHSMRHDLRRGLQVFSCMQENT